MQPEGGHKRSWDCGRGIQGEAHTNSEHMCLVVVVVGTGVVVGCKQQCCAVHPEASAMGASVVPAPDVGASVVGDSAVPVEATSVEAALLLLLLLLLLLPAEAAPVEAT